MPSVTEETISETFRETAILNFEENRRSKELNHAVAQLHR